LLLSKICFQDTVFPRVQLGIFNNSYQEIGTSWVCIKPKQCDEPRTLRTKLKLRTHSPFPEELRWGRVVETVEHSLEPNLLAVCKKHCGWRAGTTTNSSISSGSSSHQWQQQQQPQQRAKAVDVAAAALRGWLQAPARRQAPVGAAATAAQHEEGRVGIAARRKAAWPPKCPPLKAKVG
jgi:hypothetical protein